MIFLSLYSSTAIKNHPFYSVLKIVLQRVKRATVYQQDLKIASIQAGYVLLCGYERGEDVNIIPKMVTKILKAKLFDKWKKNIKEMGYQILVLSQFTLFGKLKGTKLDFHTAEEHLRAKDLFNNTIKEFKNQYDETKISCGIFGAELDIEILNHGPVTVLFNE